MTILELYVDYIITEREVDLFWQKRLKSLSLKNEQKDNSFEKDNEKWYEARRELSSKEDDICNLLDKSIYKLTEDTYLVVNHCADNGTELEVRPLYKGK